MIFGRFEWTVALRYIRAKRKESFISVIGVLSFLGIMLGMATLIIVMSVMNGFKVELQDRILGLNGHFQVMEMGHPLENYQDLMSRISALGEVRAVYPFIQSQALASSPTYSQGVVVRGLPPEGLAQKERLLNAIVSGAIDPVEFTGRKAIIGKYLSRYMGVGVGDKFTLISPRMMATAFGSMPRQMVVDVIGVFDVGMYEYDENFVFMPLDAAQLFFDMGKSVNSLEVLVYDPADVWGSGKAIYSTLGPYQDLRDWQSTSGFIDALMVERNVMFIILSLMIAIAAFNIISAMIMLVKDKGKDIAILRTMGATQGMVMRIFFIVGSMIGVVGTAFGTLIGVVLVAHLERIQKFIQSFTDVDLFSPEVYYLTHLPAVLTWGDVIIFVVLSLTLSFLATLYPSWRASKLDPVEALRYE